MRSEHQVRERLAQTEAQMSILMEKWYEAIEGSRGHEAAAAAKQAIELKWQAHILEWVLSGG